MSRTFWGQQLSVTGTLLQEGQDVPAPSIHCLGMELHSLAQVWSQAPLPLYLVLDNGPAGVPEFHFHALRLYPL